jgi:hypothetical protein
MTAVEQEIRVPAGRRATPGHPTRSGGHAPGDEESSIARVVESLVTMFPRVPEADIRERVEHLRAGFAHARIRTYIPILVARQARAALIACSSAAEDGRVG